MTNDIKDALTKEAQRIEEDCLHSMKGHYNAADSKARLHQWLGLPAAVSAAIASGTAFGEQEVVAGSLAFLTTVLIAVLMFLKPSERAEQHKAAAARYHSLRNDIRRFQELEILSNADTERLIKELKLFGNHHNELNEISPSIPRAAYEKAKKDIDEGRANYEADEAKDDSK